MQLSIRSIDLNRNGSDWYVAGQWPQPQIAFTRPAGQDRLFIGDTVTVLS